MYGVITAKWSMRVQIQRGTIAPPKTYKSNFIHHNFVQLEKQHS